MDDLSNYGQISLPTSPGSSTTASVRGIDAIIQPVFEARTALVDVEEGRHHYGGTDTGERPLISTFRERVKRVMELSTSCTATVVSLYQSPLASWTRIGFLLSWQMLNFLAAEWIIGPTSKVETSKFAKRIKYYVPATAWVPNYSFSLCATFLLSLKSKSWRIHSFGGDFIAGATVACMLIPQSVSYASSLAKLSPISGLVRSPIISLWVPSILTLQHCIQ
jgi:hypothetical protein